jgi:DNA-binding HxlR family transcriptional regulator
MKKHTNTGSSAEICAPTEIELNEFRRAVSVIVGRWKIDILWVLLKGPLRFGELRSALPGITQHMLTAQLRTLEADGLVRRTAYAEIPPRVEYRLTDHAVALKPIFLAMMEWARTLRTKSRPVGKNQSAPHEKSRKS